MRLLQDMKNVESALNAGCKQMVFGARMCMKRRLHISIERKRHETIYFLISYFLCFLVVVVTDAVLLRGGNYEKNENRK